MEHATSGACLGAFGSSLSLWSKVKCRRGFLLQPTIVTGRHADAGLTSRASYFAAKPLGLARNPGPSPCFLAVITGFIPVNHQHFEALCRIHPEVAMYRGRAHSRCEVQGHLRRPR